MSQSILFNGVSYLIPDTGDTDWGEALTDYFIAIPQGALQKTGGNFILTADVNFGPTFGPVAVYVKSEGDDISSAGFIRMERTAGIGWRNEANDGNVILAVNSSNELTFNGIKLVQSGLIVNADIAANAAIDRSKLASGTASHVLINDGLGVMSSEAQLAITRGGTGEGTKTDAFDALSPMTTSGDIIYGGASGTGTRLPKGSDTQVLTLVSGIPSWQNTGAATAPTVQKFLSTGSTTGYLFTVTSANATAGATYTNNGNTYTVLKTITGETRLFTSQASAPQSSGTLTKSGGTGDTTITFSSALATGTYTTPTSPSPLYISIRAVGGGGGSSGSGTAGAGDGGDGGDTVFGPVTAGGGKKGQWTTSPGGAGGSASLGAGPIGIALTGGSGSGGGTVSSSGILMIGAAGGNSALGGGGGGGGFSTLTGMAGSTNTGGGGGAAATSAANSIAGSSGGGGGFIDALILSPLDSTYSYAVGAAGSAGTAGTSGATGYVGGSGSLLITEYYQ